MGHSNYNEGVLVFLALVAHAFIRGKRVPDNQWGEGATTLEWTLSGERWTVDYPEDLEFIRRVYSEFKGREGEFSLQEVSDLLSKYPGLRNKIGGNYRNISLKRSSDDIGFKNE